MFISWVPSQFRPWWTDISTEPQSSGPGSAFGVVSLQIPQWAMAKLRMVGDYHNLYYLYIYTYYIHDILKYTYTYYILYIYIIYTYVSIMDEYGKNSCLFMRWIG